MSRHHPPIPNTEQTVIDFDAPDPEPAQAVSKDMIAEPSAQEYSIAPAWIDTAGRTRTWALKDPHGTQMAEITTKRDAHKLAAILNRVSSDEHTHSR